MKTFRIFIVLFLGVVGHMATAQEPQRVPIRVPQSGAYRMLTDNGTTVIPFEFISKHVVVPVEVNGQTLHLILDTGMPFDGALLFGSEKIDALDLRYIGKAPVLGAGGNRVEADMTMDVTIRVPGVEFNHQMVLVMPQDSIRTNHFEGKDGVIGQTLFSRFVVGIDHEKMEVTLTEPDRFSYTGTGREFPLRIDRYPFILCEAAITGDGTIPLELVVDTGNGAELTLNTRTQEGLVLPEKTIEYHTRSVGQEIARQMGRIERLQIGPYVLEHLLCSFRTPEHEPPPPWSKEGALGQGVLRRFNTFFDYKGERIILEPNDHYNDPSDFNMAGIQCIRTTKGSFRINRVIPASPAGEAGLRLGDGIYQVDGKPASQVNVDDFDALLRKEGRQVELDIRRGNETIHIRLTLRRLI